MTDREAFISAIAANPADDAPRMVFADWLDEHGEAARAGFIRDQVQLAKLRPGSDEYRTLFRHTADTLRANLPAWIADVCEAFGQPADWWQPLTRPGRGLGVNLHRGQHERGLQAVEFVRGFLDWVGVHLSEPRNGGAIDQLFLDHPVTRLSMTFPHSVGEWRTVATPALGRVQSLHLAGLSQEDVAAAIFGDPCWTGVTKLSIPYTSAETLPKLCASPLAKRLTGLRLPCLPGYVADLKSFPVDDRLQQFVLHAPPARVFGTQEALGHLSAATFRPTLVRLDLTGCTLGDRGLAAFARGDVWIRLKALVLDRNRFGDPGWRDFVRSHRTPELRLLSASRNFVTGDGADRLGRSSLAATLEYIDLRGNRIDGKGAVSLARSLAGGPLKKLLLAGNPFAVREAAAVRQVLGLRVDVGG